MKYFGCLVGWILVQFLVFNSGKAETVFMSSVTATVDTIIDCRVLVESQNGAVKLEAVHGKGIGPKIQYMAEWEAFGYFNASDRIEWIMEVAEAGTYDIFLEWSADGGVVGNPYQIVIGDQVLNLKVEDTGSWEVFKRKLIGEVHIDQGLHRLIVRPDPKITEGGYLDVRALELILRN